MAQVAVNRSEREGGGNLNPRRGSGVGSVGLHRVDDAGRFIEPAGITGVSESGAIPCIVCGWEESCIYCVARAVVGTDCLERVTDVHTLHLVSRLIAEGL